MNKSDVGICILFGLGLMLLAFPKIFTLYEKIVCEIWDYEFKYNDAYYNKRNRIVGVIIIVISGMIYIFR